MKGEAQQFMNALQAIWLPYKEQPYVAKYLAIEFTDYLQEVLIFLYSLSIAGHFSCRRRAHRQAS